MAAALATAATVLSFCPPPSHRPCRTSSSLLQTTHCETGIWKMQMDDSYHYERVNLPTRTQSTSHAIFGNLLQPNLLEQYHVYKRQCNHLDNKEHDDEHSNEIVLAVIKLGDNLDGHEGVVHGGIIALLLDDTMGFAYEAMGIVKAVTASLKVDYRMPVLAGSMLLIKVRLSSRQGRKLYFEAQVTSPDEKVLYAEATSLYIVPREHYQEDAAAA